MLARGQTLLPLARGLFRPISQQSGRHSLGMGRGVGGVGVGCYEFQQVRTFNIFDYYDKYAHTEG